MSAVAPLPVPRHRDIISRRARGRFDSQIHAKTRGYAAIVYRHLCAFPRGRGTLVKVMTH